MLHLNSIDRRDVKRFREQNRMVQRFICENFRGFASRVVDFAAVLGFQGLWTEGIEGQCKCSRLIVVVLRQGRASNGRFQYGYNCTATAADFDIYAPNATFEDPLMQAHGVAQIKSAFYAIPKKLTSEESLQVFKEGRIVEYTVEEEEKTPTSGEIRLHNLQHYKVMSKHIEMRSLIKLQVEGGKVVRHEDLWDKNPLWNRNTVKLPLVGRLAETWRRGNMMATHVCMGFGKDR
uniref:Uncharacterized protein n=1 Tax=Physcomitrium patens TaxID=3218 RepID=A0A7I4BSS8_PHYPA